MIRHHFRLIHNSIPVTSLLLCIFLISTILTVIFPQSHHLRHELLFSICSYCSELLHLTIPIVLIALPQPTKLILFLLLPSFHLYILIRLSLSLLERFTDLSKLIAHLLLVTTLKDNTRLDKIRQGMNQREVLVISILIIKVK